jgi:hypothetical protein
MRYPLRFIIMMEYTHDFQELLAKLDVYEKWLFLDEEEQKTIPPPFGWSFVFYEDLSEWVVAMTRQSNRG